jgi:hypothetical protein
MFASKILGHPERSLPRSLRQTESKDPHFRTPVDVTNFGDNTLAFASGNKEEHRNRETARTNYKYVASEVRITMKLSS